MSSNTRVDLHLALLALFAHIDVRLPDLVVATLTLRSVMTAMEKGIAAADIYHFLAVRAHPTVTARGPPVPENVADQLHLWEAERARVRFAPAALLHGFPSDAAFADCERHARDVLKALRWSAPREREILVDDAALAPLRQWMADYTAAAAAAAGATGAAAGATGAGAAQPLSTRTTVSLL